MWRVCACARFNEWGRQKGNNLITNKIQFITFWWLCLRKSVARIKREHRKHNRAFGRDGSSGESLKIYGFTITYVMYIYYYWIKFILELDRIIVASILSHKNHLSIIIEDYNRWRFFYRWKIYILNDRFLHFQSVDWIMILFKSS